MAVVRDVFLLRSLLSPSEDFFFVPPPVISCRLSSHEGFSFLARQMLAGAAAPIF